MNSAKELAEENVIHTLFEALKIRWQMEKERGHIPEAESLFENIIMYYGIDEAYRILNKQSKLGKVLA